MYLLLYQKSLDCLLNLFFGERFFFLSLWKTFLSGHFSFAKKRHAPRRQWLLGTCLHDNKTKYLFIPIQILFEGDCSLGKHLKTGPTKKGSIKIFSFAGNNFGQRIRQCHSFGHLLRYNLPAMLFY